MHLLNNVFTNEHGEAITVLQLLTKFKQVLSEIDTYLNDYGNRLNSIELKNTQQGEDILILISNVTVLQNKVNNIQLTLGDYLLRFNDLDLQLQNINGKITTNENDILQLQTYVNNIGTQIIDINNKLNLLSLTVQNHTTQISNLKNNVDTINSTLIDVNNSIDLINTQISNLSNFITNFESRLSTLEDDVISINNKNTSQDNTLTNHNNRITLLENSGVGGGNLQYLGAKIIHYTIPQGMFNLDYGNYIFHTLPAGTDLTKVIIMEQVFGTSAGDADALSKTGVNFGYYIQNGVDIYSLSKLGSPATQSMEFDVYYHFYKVL